MFYEREIEIDVIAYRNGVGKHKRIIQGWEDVYQYLEYALPLAIPGTDELELILWVSGSDICPAPLITDFSRQVFQMYQLCGSNRWPYPGGYYDQLSLYIEAASIISAEENRITQREIAKQRGKR